MRNEQDEALLKEYQKMVSYYGVQPKAIFDDIYNAMVDIVSDIVDDVELTIKDNIARTQQQHISSKDPIQEGLNKFLKTLHASIDLIADAFEKVAIAHVFRLPPNFEPAQWNFLSEQEFCDTELQPLQAVQESDDFSHEEFIELREKINQAYALNHTLSRENKTLRTELSLFEEAKPKLQLLEHSLEEEHIESLPELLEHILSIGKQLHQMFKRVKQEGYVFEQSLEQEQIIVHSAQYDNKKTRTFALPQEEEDVQQEHEDPAVDYVDRLLAEVSSDPHDVAQFLNQTAPNKKEQ